MVEVRGEESSDMVVGGGGFDLEKLCLRVMCFSYISLTYGLPL